MSYGIDMKLSKEEAISIGKAYDWKKLSDFELVRRQLFTKRLFVPEFSIFKEAVGNFLGRPVYTHEFSSDFVEDLKEEFENVCKERGY